MCPSPTERYPPREQGPFFSTAASPAPSRDPGTPRVLRFWEESSCSLLSPPDAKPLGNSPPENQYISFLSAKAGKPKQFSQFLPAVSHWSRENWCPAQALFTWRRQWGWRWERERERESNLLGIKASYCQKLWRVWGLPYLQANRLASKLSLMLARRRETPGSEVKNFVTTDVTARVSARYSSQSPLPPPPGPRHTCTCRGLCGRRRSLSMHGSLLFLKVSHCRCNPEWCLGPGQPGSELMAYTGRTCRDAQGPQQISPFLTNQIRFPFPWKQKKRMKRIQCYFNTSLFWGTE